MHSGTIHAMSAGTHHAFPALTVILLPAGRDSCPEKYEHPAYLQSNVDSNACC
jgi:hypothetical protein